MNEPRLLVVDDNPDIGNILVDIGVTLGYDTRYTGNYSEFERHADGWRPMVVITDLQMPDIDGVALLRQLAAAKSSAKVVIISGMPESLISMAARVGRDRGLNVVATFSKPFNVASVSELLRKIKPPPGIDAEALKAALLGDQIEAYFQPKCRLIAGRVVGAEVLARWTHPVHGEIPPHVFVPLADRSDLSNLLLEKVMTKALRHVARWTTGGFTAPVAINVSSSNVRDLDLPDKLERICMILGVPCHQIILELTESDSVDSSADIFDVLTRLRLKGFQLSIDDFGTGFSSLQRLKEMPFTELKIDRTFITNIHTDGNSGIIVRAMISLAENFGIRCVAEGIEDAATAALLLDWGCMLGQGYLYGRPMPAYRFAEGLQQALVSGDAAALVEISATDAA